MSFSVTYSNPKIYTVTYANPKVFTVIRLYAAVVLQNQYVEYTDGTGTWRKGVRDTYFVLDKTLTATGFSGTENVDWENIRELK